MSTETPTQRIVRTLDAIPTGDPEAAHILADNLLLQAVPAEVAAAYQRLVDRSPWWACA